MQRIEEQVFLNFGVALLKFYYLLNENVPTLQKEDVPPLQKEDIPTL